MMNTATDDLTSCDPQHFPDAPDVTWTFEDLREYARTQERAIVDGEQSLTVYYWRLGHALELVRRQLTHSQWGRYLETLGVDKTRASKARAIHRTFEVELDVAELSVQQAYERRERRPRKTTQPNPWTSPVQADNHSTLNPIEFLVDVCRRAELCAMQAESTSPEQAVAVLSAVDEALRELTALRLVLSRRAGSI